MFKAMKFIYNLGVKQERQRIKNAVLQLQRELEGAYKSDNAFLNELDPTHKTKREDVKRQLNINHEVGAILERLTRPTGKWIEEGTAPIDGDKLK